MPEVLDLTWVHLSDSLSGHEQALARLNSLASRDVPRQLWWNEGLGLKTEATP